MPFDRLDNRWVAVAEQQRAVAAPIIDHPIVIHIPLIRPVGAFHEEREGIGVAAIVSRTAGKALQGAFGQDSRAGKSLAVELFE